MSLKYIIEFLKGGKKMEGTLEKICLTKVKVMRMSVVPDELDKCFTCEGFDKECPNYKPNGNISVKRGSVALGLYKQGYFVP